MKRQKKKANEKIGNSNRGGNVVTDYVNQPWRFQRVLDGRRIQDAGREDSDTLDTFDATDLRNIDPGKHTLCAPFSTDDSAADASASPAADSLN